MAAETIGQYTADLLGNIRSHLAGLQGYDVMTLELIQNADDAKATEIVFDVTDRGLLVHNSGEFTYCGDLNKRPCAFVATTNCKCDFHRITEVGSGGKLSRSENIGRFGIGFVSTYQVTDHPEICSSGIKLTLRPERGEWAVESLGESDGTSFFLPWADDPNTEARVALGVSHLDSTHIDQLADDLQDVISRSLLFLRHVRKAELRRNGHLLLACDFERGEGSELLVHFRPAGETERWHILRADASDAAQRLYAAHPRLESLRRSTKISIGVRLTPAPLVDGLLYAFLPTEQLTGLPLHINADFFPEADRKAAIFSGHQHEQAWNEMLIDAAAAELARSPEGLLKLLGRVQLWQILSRANELFSKSSGHPSCFKLFWERLKGTATQAAIVSALDGSFQRPSRVFIPRISLNDLQAKVLLEVGGSLATEDLRPFQNAMAQLGAPVLTLDRLVTLLESVTAQRVAGETQVDEETLEQFYLPLWTTLNELLPEGGASNPSINPTVKRLQTLPVLVTEDLYVVAIDQSRTVPAGMMADRIAHLLRKQAIVSHRLSEFPKINRLIDDLDLSCLVSYVANSDDEPLEDILHIDRNNLRDLYSLFADLDRRRSADQTVYQQLRGLPIWKASRGLVKASEVLLPGDFTDPTGQADLLDASLLNEPAREFLVAKLGVQTQTIETFARTVLPTFFNDAGPLNPLAYVTLINELANHSKILNDEDIRRLLGELPILPTRDGGWRSPVTTYRRSDDLVRVLGDSPHLWLDEERIPNARSVRVFIDNLGMRREPTIRHLVDRIILVAKNFLPTDEAKRASSEPFYVLCEHYAKWKEEAAFQDAIRELRGAACLPITNDGKHWHSPSSVHAPYRAEAFESQAQILDFRDSLRLSSDFLRDLGVQMVPPTQLVIGHMRNCVSVGKPVPYTTYQILSERARNEQALLKTLTGEFFIYVNGKYVPTNRLFWQPQLLGQHTYTIPANYEVFKPLFDAVGIKNEPDGVVFVDILLDIVGGYFERTAPLIGPDKAIYDACLAGISSARERGELAAADLERLQKAPIVANLLGHLIHPDEVLLQDSEWYAGFFDGELDQALCKPAPELWPLVEATGVRRLSESTRVALEFVDGPEVDGTSLAASLAEREEIFDRLLHDKPAIVREKVRAALASLKAVSYDVVRTQATVNIGGDPVTAPSVPTVAFYDTDAARLVVTRPVSERSWAHVLNALFHQLMPGESGSEIAKLTLSVRPLMTMPVEEAHSELTDAGIPLLDNEALSTDDLTSPHLEELVSPMAPTGPSESDASSFTASSAGELGADPQSPPDTRTEPVPTDGAESEANSNGHGVELPGSSATPAVRWRNGGSSSQRTAKSRPAHKQQWDRRLLSYVRKKTEDAEDTDESGERTGASEHNLAVEAVARDAVCAYETARGRVPEQMPQTHPGYDIISRNPLTDEDRFIEVKGISGEWNQTGVGLSRLQFSNAQAYGDRYWLYVVEFTSSTEHLRIHPIQSPAAQITTYMFDGNWRDTVTEEQADPAGRFVAGARVHHQDQGTGEIRDVVKRGNTRLLTILFDGDSQPTPNVILNLHRMRIVEGPNGDNAS